ncbi:glycoside hydrolase family 3 C-terminal domain-containing protein [Parahaliea mediterranea]|uniref:glycoside hydrolase family 3 C-terminal domain-containing protein n=1 Tax=Parahaliea mediterranea TaxID=651086 RepID=UPI0014735252|nr:glycoside hydrolase family 3 C-terminal domain-containing protein [Parahaliea mediterranea]
MNSSAEPLLDALTTEEKAALCSGGSFWQTRAIERLGIPALLLTDGPHGLRKQAGGADHVGLQASIAATCFPSAAGLACSWNTELLTEVGSALGLEARAEGVHVLLGPGVNIKRHPLGGRNFEYFSEDPFLSGVLAAAWINGLQRQGVGASLKHFAVNNHEHGRMVVDAVLDERTLREIYLPAFEHAIKTARPWTVMCAYNKLNGTYLSENALLLNQILRDEWGFGGLVLSDWGAVNDRVRALQAGMDLEMPTSGEVNTRRILAALASGDLPMATLDQAVVRLLALIDRSQRSPAALPNELPDKLPDNLLETNHALARCAAEQACVLLRNESGRLPLSPSGRIAVIGQLAEDTRYQGSGSSQINPSRLEQPLQAIRDFVDERAHIDFAPGYSVGGQTSDALQAEAYDLLEAADVAVVFLGLPPAYESEGFDREHMHLPSGQLTLLDALLPLADKLVVVLQNGAPVALPFAEQVPAILETYLGGQAGASALARILFGDANPCGKLAETFPLAADDAASAPFFPGGLRQSQYCEALWVGYRYFATAGVPVRYPFGHGLSYTRFEYSDLAVEPGDASSDTAVASVSFSITNTGDRAGAEVAQVYIGQRHPSLPRPARELKHFARLQLEPGQQRRVSLALNRRAFAYWDSGTSAWRAEADIFRIEVGASSADIRLTGQLTLAEGPARRPQPAGLAPYADPASRQFDRAAFEALLGHPVPVPVPARPYHLNSTLGEVQATWLGRQLKNIMAQQAGKTLNDDASESARRMIEAIVEEMPLRNLVTHSEGKLSPGLMRAMIHIMNHDWRKLLRRAPEQAR